MAATGLITENEALIESSFRRLLASIESEREKLRNTWQQIQGESSTTVTELARIRQDTEEWCHSERYKVESEWKRLDKLRERMSVLWPSDRSEFLEINCSGEIFSIPKAALCSIEGSYLNHMFSDAFAQSVPRDGSGRFFLDFNPVCFALIVEFLQARWTKPDAQPPPVPPEQRQNMDLLAEALRLKPFLRLNEINQKHGTSLRVAGNVIVATHPGWQVISSRDPLLMSGSSYFETQVMANPDKMKGGLAIGVCGHMPEGKEIHTIRLNHTIFYSSNNGLIGDDVAVHNVEKGIQFIEGSVLGIRHDITSRSLFWYHNRLLIGGCSLKKESIENFRVLYPVFALFCPNQKIQVDFSANNPSARSADKTVAALQ